MRLGCLFQGPGGPKGSKGSSVRSVQSPFVSTGESWWQSFKGVFVRSKVNDMLISPCSFQGPAGQKGDTGTIGPPGPPVSINITFLWRPL